MRYLLILSLLILLTSCGAGSQQSESRVQEIENDSAQSLEHLDPYSAPLYPAQKEALATDFEVTLLSGESFRLSDQKGKVVLMNIWATWCPPCRDETPDLVELYNKYKDQGYVTPGISVDEQGESVVRPFMEEFDVNYPMYIDTDETVMKNMGQLWASQPPTLSAGKATCATLRLVRLRKRNWNPGLKNCWQK